MTLRAVNYLMGSWFAIPEFARMTGEALSAAADDLDERIPFPELVRPRPTLPLFDSGSPDLSDEASAMFGGGS